MTSKEEMTTPVVARPLAEGFVDLKVATDEALEVLNLNPVPTTWKSDTGRPIYFRLPAISQQYQKGYDRDQAFVYIEPKFGKPFGAGSLQVGRREDQKTLFVENGEITWMKGQVLVSAFEVDTSTLNFGQGLSDGLYQVGYTLDYADPTDDSIVPGYALATVEDSLLSEASVDFGATAASENHEAFRALSFDGAWWPGGTTDANGEMYILDFKDEVYTDKFVLVGDEREVSTALLNAEYSLDGINWVAPGTEGDPPPTSSVIDDGIYETSLPVTTVIVNGIYDLTAPWPDNIDSGEFRDSIDPSPIENGDGIGIRPIDGRWEVPVYRNFKARYWRFRFTDGTASIQDILYTGEAYFPDNRVTGPVQTATAYIDGFYEEVPGDYLLLASFEIKAGSIALITDYRRVDTFRYEPVSDWTTDFQDSTLRCLFDDVENYATKFLAPPTADFHLYEEMDTSVCYGLGELDISEENVDA